MIFNFKDFENLFLEKFITPTYEQWKCGKGSGKDIVGKNFEDF